MRDANFKRDYYAAAQVLCIKKLKGRDVIRVAAKHNLREIQAETGSDSHIDHLRTPLNQVIAGPSTASEVAACAKRLMEDAGVRPLRKDAVRAIEIVVSLSAGSTINPSEFFSNALEWVRRYFNVPVLSVVIHADESAPHCHVLLLPLVNGHMMGSELVGYRTHLQSMQMSFFDQVGQAYGLNRPKAHRRLNSAARGKAASMILTAIQDNLGLLDSRDVQDAMLQMLAHDPEPLLAVLKLGMPTSTRPKRSFVKIMTKPCGAEKPPAFERQAVRKLPNPILCRVRSQVPAQSESEVSPGLCDQVTQGESIKSSCCDFGMGCNRLCTRSSLWRSA